MHGEIKKIARGSDIILQHPRPLNILLCHGKSAEQKGREEGWKEHLDIVVDTI